MVKFPCGSSEAKEPKTVNIFQGYFFMVNFCLGTGFLGVPFSFFYGGYMAAIPTLATAAFVTWLTSTWLLEVMARAQVSYTINVVRGVAEAHTFLSLCRLSSLHNLGHCTWPRGF